MSGWLQLALAGHATPAPDARDRNINYAMLTCLTPECCACKLQDDCLAALGGLLFIFFFFFLAFVFGLLTLDLLVFVFISLRRPEVSHSSLCVLN